MNQELSLPRELVNQMLTHAQQHPEQEICGLITLSPDESKHYLPIANRAKDQSHRYEMDDEQLVESFRQMRERDEKLLAIVHSHPHSPAMASRLDIELAQYPDAYYLIISLNTLGVLEMRAYKINEGIAEEVKLSI